jgi:hypothetical protein
MAGRPRNGLPDTPTLAGGPGHPFRVAVVLRIADGSLQVKLTGRDRLYTLRGSIEVPLASIAEARAAERASVKTAGLVRAPGTSLPGQIKAGTFRSLGRKEFWDVRHADWVLELDLRDHELARIVLEVPDPEAEAARIRAALNA